MAEELDDFELDPYDRDDDYPYDYVYIHDERGRLWPTVLGLSLLILFLFGYWLEDRYTRPPKVETAPTYQFAEYWLGQKWGMTIIRGDGVTSPYQVLNYKGGWREDEDYFPDDVVVLDGHAYVADLQNFGRKPPVIPWTRLDGER